MTTSIASDSLSSGVVPKRFTNFAADIDFPTVSLAFTGNAAQARNPGWAREIIATGTGVIQLRTLDAADSLLALNVDDFNGVARLTSRFVGVEATGTTLVGALYVIW